MEMTWNAVNCAEQIDLPAPWPRLLVGGFSPVLYERVRRFALNERRAGRLGQVEEFIVRLGESYLPRAFFVSHFVPRGQTPEARELQASLLLAIGRLADDFGQLIPAVLWNTLAVMSSRPDPTEEESILSIQDQLRDPWYFADGALHALGVTYGLLLYVQSRLSQETGHILVHGCGCNHQAAVAERGSLNFQLPPERWRYAGKEFLDHLFGQTTLILVAGYPFVLNPEEAGSRHLMSMMPPPQA